MRCVIVESPFAGNVARNVEYARRAMRDCLDRGEAPFASHLLYTQPGVLDDCDPSERSAGILAGLAIGDRMDASAFYVDLGVSSGMMQGWRRAMDAGRIVEIRWMGAP